jgi:hypothetical protein
MLAISEKTVYSYVSRNMIAHYKIEANVRFRPFNWPSGCETAHVSQHSHAARREEPRCGDACDEQTTNRTRQQETGWPRGCCLLLRTSATPPITEFRLFAQNQNKPYKRVSIPKAPPRLDHRRRTRRPGVAAEIPVTVRQIWQQKPSAGRARGFRTRDLVHRKHVLNRGAARKTGCGRSAG